MNRVATSRDHRECTSNTCHASKLAIDQLTKPTHREDNCQCRLEDVKAEKLTNILMQGLIPLVRFHYSKVPALELIAWDSKAEYIAISHVWADGLGNPRENAVQTCQLQWLMPRFDGLVQVAQLKKTQDPILFWLDTLCCPVGADVARKKAIGMMGDVYKNAAHVLVLDAELSQVQLEAPDIIKPSMYLFTSGWMRRLWTLQEAMFGKRVWILYENGFVELEKMFHMLRNEMGVDYLAQASIAADLTGCLMALRFNKYLRSSAASRGLDLRFAFVHTSTQLRSTTKKKDEAICIATLFGLDVERIASLADHHERVCEVWRQLSTRLVGIPAQLIFNTGTRLNIPQFRWAPDSLLKYDEARVLAVETDQLATLTDNGLAVRFPGIAVSFERLIQFGSSEEFPTTVQRYSEDTGPVLLLRHSSGTWSALQTWTKDAADWTTTFALYGRHAQFAVISLQCPSEIISSSNPVSPGLVVKIIGRNDTTLLVHSIAPTRLNVGDVKSQIYETVYQRVKSLAKAANGMATFAEAIQYYTRMVADEDVVREILDALGVEGDKKHFVGIIMILLKIIAHGGYVKDDLTLGKTSLWHVD